MISRRSPQKRPRSIIYDFLTMLPLVPMGHAPGGIYGALARKCCVSFRAGEHSFVMAPYGAYEEGYDNGPYVQGYIVEQDGGLLGHLEWATLRILDLADIAMLADRPFDPERYPLPRDKKKMGIEARVATGEDSPN